MKLFNFRKLQNLDQGLPFWRARVKSTWNFIVYMKFSTFKLCIFHLENLEFCFQKSERHWIPNAENQTVAEHKKAILDPAFTRGGP